MNYINILDNFERKFPMVKVFDVEGKDIYAYDAKSNLLAKVTLDEINQIYRFDFEGTSMPHYSNNYISELISAGVFLPGALKKIVPDNNEIFNIIEDDIESYMPRNLMIEITERCNLSCKYCFFSKEDGFEMRKHSLVDIELSTAYKAIDYYYQKYIKALSKYPKTKRELIIKKTPPSLQWWGGEPFIVFDKIVQTKEYFELLDWGKYGVLKRDLIYGLSSNLTVFNNEILKFLVKNNIRLKVSIDGNEACHNINRVFLNGKGTFKTVIRNIMKIINCYPNYAKSFVGIQTVLADNIDYIESIEYINDFFKLNSPDKKILTCSFFPQRNNGVFLSNLEMTDDSIESSVFNFKRRINEISLKNLNELYTLFSYNVSLFAELKKLITTEDYLVFDNPKGSDYLSRSFSCPLGVDTTFVSTKGQIHCCCKTDYSFPIGDIEVGINREKLKKVYSLYYNKIRDKCNSCWAHNFCNICPALVGINGDFSLPNEIECSYIKKNTLIRLTKYII